MGVHVCGNVCVCVGGGVEYVCALMSVKRCGCLHVYECLCVSVCARSWACVCPQVCVHVHACMYECIGVCSCVHVCVRVYTKHVNKPSTIK